MADKMEMEKIFGRKFEDIKQMQQKTYKPKLISVQIDLPVASDEDVALFAEHGINGLTKMKFFGVLDRINNSKIIKRIR